VLLGNVKIMTILGKIVIIYVVQALICAMINVVNANRIPRNFFDLLKLTFLPWLLLHLKEAKNN
jgi:hypothetical protein